MGLLEELDYRNVRLYAGGMIDWTKHRLPVERGRGEEAAHTDQSSIGSAGRSSHAQPAFNRHRWERVLIDAVSSRSIGELLLLWLLMITGFGVLYWIAGVWGGVGASPGAFPGAFHGLRVGSSAVESNWQGALTAVYFSFVTALSIGYGDVIPVSIVRVFAVVEGISGLLIFGCVISKLVSQRQEELIGEIHRTTFEDRLGRVRTNLHLVLSELQAIAEMCDGRNGAPERALARVESAAAVFAGELRAIHDLLYRPQQNPDEQTLESILANLTASLGELSDLLYCQSELHSRATTLRASLRSVTSLANEICGECVPREVAPHLKNWMNRIQGLARKIERFAN
ncbi:MAG: ion channel [Acidobacteria bacterium]|nr:ion channel [Acidobacteriota bacterium]